MLLGSLLRARALACSGCTDALAAAGWAASSSAVSQQLLQQQPGDAAAGASPAASGSGQQLQQRRHAGRYTPVVERREDGGFDAEATYAHWKEVWRPGPRRREAPPPPRGVALEPQERDLLQDTAQRAGLPPAAAARVVAAVEAGVLPLDPVVLAERIRGIAEIEPAGGSGSAGGAGAGGLDAVRLLSTPEGPALLSAAPSKLRTQVALLAKLLPEYRTEWLLTALPRLSLHGPGLVAKRLTETERVFKEHLGLQFPRERLGAAGQRWRWLVMTTERAKTVAALELIMAVGPELAGRMLLASPQLLGARPERVQSSLTAVAEALGVPTQRAAELLARQPAVLLRPPERLAAAASALSRLMRDDTATVVAMVEQQPSLLQYSSSTAWEDKLAVIKDLLGISGTGSRTQLLAAAAAAPNLLTRSADALRASWDALETEAGPAGARDLIIGPSGSPALLAVGAATLAARAAALQRLSELGGTWAQRVSAARGDAAQLGTLLAGRPAAAGERLEWLFESRQQLAPGGMSLVELLGLGEDAWADIYPQWRVRETAASAGRT